VNERDEGAPPEGESAGEEAFEILENFVEQLQSGAPPDASRLLQRHPELASALRCLEALEEVAPSFEEHSLVAQSAQALNELKPTQLLSDRASDPAGGGLFEDTQGISPGTTFGDYELECELGRGGMGVVFKARQKSLDRPVALKMILASHLASEDQVRRFLAEARAAAQMRHPNIVSIYDAGQIGAQHFFAMQYVDGPSLAARLAQQPLEIDEAVRLVAHVARAVDHLHDMGIVHRDLKPSNILLDQSGAPQVTDFGLAKAFFSDEQLTQTGVIAGTPSYMAPEQAAARSEQIGPRSDVYALGVVLYELLTGRPPFKEDNPLDTLVQVLEREPPLPRRLNRKIPRELELICLKCLEKSPENRYASALMLARDLERFLAGEPVEVRSPGLAQRLWRWSRREPALVSRLVVLASFFVVELANYGLGFVPAGFHKNVGQIMFLWALASLGFQQLLKTRRWAVMGRYGWAVVEMLLFTLVLREADGAASPLVVGYPLLIVGAGLWFQVRMVWFVTALAVLSYLGLVIEFYQFRPDLQARFDTAYDRPIFFLQMLIILGVAVAYQVHRVRALSRYYESRHAA
jgi:serine/threonine-protein kinase